MSAPPPRSIWGSLAKAIIRVASRLVPVRHRARWLREWQAELWHREDALARRGAVGRSGLTRLVVPALGSLSHAIWMRARPGTGSGLLRDLRFAVRILLRHPGFTWTAIGTLALGIGGNVAVLSVVHGALVRAYPYADGERILALSMRDDQRPGTAGLLSYPDLEVAATVPALASVAGYDWDPVNLSLPGGSRWVGVGLVSPGFMETLGAGLVEGRGFLPEEDDPGSEPVAIVSESLWRSAFPGRPAVGASIRIDEQPHRVVGLAPAFLDIPAGAEVWIPLRPTGRAATRQSFWLGAVARLGDGWTAAEARSSLETLGRALAAEFPDTHAGRTLDATTLREWRTGGVRAALLAVMVGLVLVLLVICTNLTSLGVARAWSRERELAVRRAIGASRGRLVLQFLTEAGVLALCAGVLGVGIAALGVHLLLPRLPAAPTWLTPAFGFPVYAAAALLTLAALFFLGLAPLGAVVLRTRRRRVGPSGPSRDLLLLVQVAGTTLLLVAATHLSTRLVELNRVDPGFATENRVSGSLVLPGRTYADGDAIRRFANELVEQLENAPSIQAGAIVSRMPFRSGVNSVLWWEDGQPEQAFRENPQAQINAVSSDYFATMDVPVLRGRGIEDRDDERAERVVVVNERFARTHFGDRSPIGRSISFTYPPEFHEIVGVVGDVTHQELGSRPVFQIYTAFAQHPGRRMSVVVRGRTSASVVGPALSDAIARVDPGLAIADLRGVDQTVRASYWHLRLATRVFLAIATFASLLAAVGIAGITFQNVSRRQHELAVRLALGASTRDVTGVLAGRLAAFVGAGLALGAGLSLVGSRLVAHRIPGVAPVPLVLVLAVVLSFALIGVGAAVLPTRRALRIAPAQALRSD